MDNIGGNVGYERYFDSYGPVPDRRGPPPRQYQGYGQGARPGYFPASRRPQHPDQLRDGPPGKMRGGLLPPGRRGGYSQNY